jgi:hypothetical protein
VRHRRPLPDHHLDHARRRRRPELQATLRARAGCPPITKGALVGRPS